MTHVLIVGGSSGIGLGLAELLVDGGAQVTIAGRSADRLAAAAERLRNATAGQATTAQVTDGQVTTGQVDITEEDQVRRLMAEAAPLDHVVVTAVDTAGAYAPLAGFDVAAARAVLDTKLVGAWLVAKHAAPHLPAGGSITFTSGIAAYRPGPGASVIASANGALEALARSLALELAPIRVNVISPGWVDTPVWDALAGEQKTERLAGMAARLPVGRVGRPADLAQAFVAVMENGFVTGSVMHVDGGQRLI